MSKKDALLFRPTQQALLLCACFGSAASMAAERINLEQLPPASLTAAPATIHARTGLSSDELRPLRSSTFSNGNRATRFAQYYQGVPIWGEAIVERRAAKGGAVELVGTMIANLRQDLPSVQPLLDASAVLQRAKNLARVGQSRDEQVELFVKADAGDKARLVYRVSMINDSATQPERPVMLIDANNGQLLARWEGIQHVDGLGPGGNQYTGYYYYEPTGPYGALDVTQSGSTCTLENSLVRTINMKGTASLNTVHSFPCFTNGARGTTQMAVINDAHAFGTMLVKMYREWLNLPVLAQKLAIRVNYGSNYENAFWNGTAMVIGSAYNNSTLVISPDIIGHEVAHGFTAQNSNLTYSGQSGGINEAFSDMAGEALEYYRSKGSNDFLVAANTSATGLPLRYMCNPPQDGRSIDHASKYTSTLDVHYSSGVYNKAFCLLAKTTGWNTRKAFEVMAGANDLYWTASATFNSAACGVEKAAADRGYKVADVTAALSAVGASCGSVPPPPVAVSLANGVPVSVTVAAGGSKLFSIAVPAGKTQLTIKLSGGTGDADLYAKANTAPTTTSYAWRSAGSTNAENIVVSAPAATTYYVLVYGYAASNAAQLVATF